MLILHHLKLTGGNSVLDIEPRTIQKIMNRFLLGVLCGVLLSYAVARLAYYNSKPDNPINIQDGSNPI